MSSRAVNFQLWEDIARATKAAYSPFGMSFVTLHLEELPSVLHTWEIGEVNRHFAKNNVGVSVFCQYLECEPDECGDMRDGCIDPIIALEFSWKVSSSQDNA